MQRNVNLNDSLKQFIQIDNLNWFLEMNRTLIAAES